MAASGKLSDVEAFRKQVYAREEESTTGIGEGIAIPHGKCDAVKKPGLAAMVIKNGVDFDSLDGEPVTLLFLIAAPNTKDNVHLDVLSKLSVLMMDEHFSDSCEMPLRWKTFFPLLIRQMQNRQASMRDWRLIPAKKRQIQMERMPHKQVVRRFRRKKRVQRRNRQPDRRS